MANKCLKTGADGPPERLSRIPPGMFKAVDADAWFLNLYQSLGEPLAEVDPSYMDADCVAIGDADHLLWSLRIAIISGQYARKRYLSPGCFEDLFLMYEAMVPVEGSSRRSWHCAVFGGSGGKGSWPFATLARGKGARSARKSMRRGARQQRLRGAQFSPKRRRITSKRSWLTTQSVSAPIVLQRSIRKSLLFTASTSCSRSPSMAWTRPNSDAPGTCPLRLSSKRASGLNSTWSAPSVIAISKRTSLWTPTRLKTRT